MELKIKNYYTAQETEYNGLTIVSKRCVVDKDTLSDFRKDNIVKFIFLGEDEILLSLSSNPSVNEIHKFRSKYRGGTYVSVPITVIGQEESEKYFTGIIVGCDYTIPPDGYATISKRDICTLYKEYRYRSSEEKTQLGRQLCIEEINKYNSLLSNQVFKVTLAKNNEILFDDYVFVDKFEYEDIRIRLSDLSVLK